MENEIENKERIGISIEIEDGDRDRGFRSMIATGI
jgi:hypothetical protein